MDFGPIPPLDLHTKPKTGEVKMSKEIVGGDLFLAGEEETASVVRSPAELRNSFNQLLNDNSALSDQYSTTMKVLDIGETKEIILNAVATMGKFSNSKNGNGSFVSRLVARVPGLGGLAKKLEEEVKETLVEGKTIKEVSSGLISTLDSKREHTVKAAGDLEALVIQWENNFEYLRQVALETKAAHDICEARDKLGYSALFNEIMSTLDHVKENINTAIGTIKAAGLATEQVSGLIPKLRAVLQDSMIIRKTLNDLEELGEMTTMLDETTSLIRDDNFNTMKAAVIGVLDRSVISNDKIKRLENSSRRTAEFSNEVNKKLLEVNTRQMAAAERISSNVLSLGRDPKADMLTLSHHATEEEK